MREQSKAIRDLTQEVKTLKKEAKARSLSISSSADAGGTSATPSPQASMVMDDKILHQLSDLQHSSNNRHRRTRSRAAMVESKVMI